jgi:peptide-methionine (S)-S-oxide reductase
VARECGVQRELIDVLIDAGAKLASVNGAVAGRNLDAVKQLIDRGAGLTLAAAICLERQDDIERLASEARANDLQDALSAAALYGKPDALAMLLRLGADPSGHSKTIHPHASALHHAVGSGSLDAVKVLVEAGAALDMQDSVYRGTPLGWAEHLQLTETASYLRSQAGTR